MAANRGASIPGHRHRRGSQKHRAEQHSHGGRTCNGAVGYSMKEELLIEGEQMKLEVTKHNEEAAVRQDALRRSMQNSCKVPYH